MRQSLILLFVLCACASFAAPRTVTIGVVTDGPTERQLVQLDLIRREVASLMGDEFDVRFPRDSRREGDWTVDGARRALESALADPQVDVVLVMGLITSNESARIERLTKPLIATVVPDAGLQRFPFVDGRSGRRNFTYVSSVRGIDEEIRTYHTVVGFDHLTVMADASSIEAIPDLAVKTRQLADEIGFSAAVVTVTNSVADALDRLPSNTEAVYVAPLLGLPAGGIEELAKGLTARRLPSLSLLGRSEVEAGLLMSIGGLPSDDTRFARRIGLNLQRILLGEDAGDIDVSFRLGRRLLINMRTARAIGFLPRWAVLIDAEKLYAEDALPERTLTLLDTMAEAVEANLTLQASQYDVRIAGDDVLSARAALLPQLDVSATATRIDADRANPLVQPERSTDAQLGGSQLLYSERAYANLAIARRLAEAADEDYRSVWLDTLQSASTAYLSLLRAEALEAVRRSNLEVTRTNLELARVREAVGETGRADVLRWESQIARDRQEVLAAQAVRFQARTELNRVLDRPQNEAVAPVRDGLDEALAVLEDPRFDSFIGNPVVWEVFIDYSVAEAIGESPELRRLDAQLAAQKRDLLAARRAYYVPDVALSANAGSNISRGGAGSDLTGLPLDDESWTVALSATLPLFNGGALRSQRSRSENTLRRLRHQRTALARGVEARMRVALQQVGGSFPAIELSQDAARAARGNLEIVTDAYSKGAVSVTDLIDAQDAALSAELAAAEAEYAFLIDYMEILRSRGNFDLVIDPTASPRWFTAVENYFRERGVQPLRR